MRHALCLEHPALNTEVRQSRGEVAAALGINQRVVGREDDDGRGELGMEVLHRRVLDGVRRRRVGQDLIQFTRDDSLASAGSVGGTHNLEPEVAAGVVVGILCPSRQQRQGGDLGSLEVVGGRDGLVEQSFDTTPLFGS